MSDDYTIAVIPGDGIGTDVIDAVHPLLEQVCAIHDLTIEWSWFDWGSDRYRSEGSFIPDNGLDRLAEHDSIFFGAIGDPTIPDHVTLHGLILPIRKRFDQVVCQRPTYLFDGVTSPLRGYEGGDIDFVVFRENTEGEYAHIGGREHEGHSHEVAIQTSVFTRRSTEAIVRAAFESATERENHLTSVTKSNAQAYSMVFWDEIVEEIADEYPDVTVERLLVDAASMDLIRRPDQFDVIVASNLFGDILTDIGAIIGGSMGLAPSANIDPTGESPSMFEPVHGSAPDIVGKGIANPLATVLSAEMMFDHLGESTIAADLRALVAEQLADSSAPRTPDLGGEDSTTTVVDDLLNRLD